MNLVRKIETNSKRNKRKKFFRIFKTSKFLDKAFKTDLEQIIDLYNEKGFRDAEIVLDNVAEISPNLIDINISIEEGIKYHFRNIDWLGNTKYNSEYLDLLLGIKSGDVYDEKMMNERLQMSMSGTDITSLYMDDGYLFFNIDPVETLVEGDSIDYEIRFMKENKLLLIKFLLWEIPKQMIM